MRSPRIVVAVLAIGLAASLAAISPSASARVDTRPASTAEKVATAQRAETSITARVVKKRPAANKPAQLYLRGNVYGTRANVSIQRATKCSKARRVCNFAYYRTVKVNSAGIYEGVITAPPTRRSYLWRARVGDSYSEIWQTCTKRSDQSCQIPYV